MSEESPFARPSFKDTISIFSASWALPVSPSALLIRSGLKRTNDEVESNEVTLIHLCYAAGKGDLKSVKSIIEEKGVDVNLADYDGRTALHLAASEGQLEIVKYLIRYCRLFVTHIREAKTPMLLSRTDGEDPLFLMPKGGTLTKSASYSSPLEPLDNDSEVERTDIKRRKMRCKWITSSCSTESISFQQSLHSFVITTDS